MNLLEKLNATQTEHDRAWVVLRFSLDGLDPVLSEVVWIAAIPHWFDPAFLRALGGEVTESIYENLVGLSFVESFPERGHNIHESSRALLLHHLWQDNPDRFRLLSKYAADYCASFQTGDVASEIESIYHLLVAAPDKGIAEMHLRCRGWYGLPSFADDRVEAMIRLAREHADAERLTQRGAQWLLLWEARLDSAYERLDAAEEKLLTITASDDPLLVAEIALTHGDLQRLRGDFLLALSSYRYALPLFQTGNDLLGAAEAQAGMGLSELSVHGFTAAEPHFKKALELYKSIGHTAGEQKCVERLNLPTLFMNNLGHVERTTRHLAKHLHFEQEETDDLFSLVTLKLVEDDYAILRRFGGRSSIKTYLTTIINYLARDYSNHIHGKWRSSAEATRLGGVAPLLERLLIRDGHSFEEACSILKSKYQTDLTQSELEQIHARLPARIPRSMVSEELLSQFPEEGAGSDQRVLKAERQEMRGTLQTALEQALDELAPEDRLIMTLRTEIPMREISRALNIEPKQLYRRTEKLLRQLRQSIEKQGISREDITDFLAGVE